MKLSIYNVPLVKFLATQNTIKVTNRGELEQLKELVKEIGLDLKLNWDIVKNNSNFAGYVCVEYDNNRGTSYYLDEEDSTEWYGEPPINMEELWA